MEFNDDDRAAGSQIEDRRGRGYGGHIAFGAGGLGVVGTIIYVVFRLLGGGDVSSDYAQDETRYPSQRGVTQQQAPITGSCKGVTSQTDNAKFIACVVGNVQGFWQQRFASNGKPYEIAKLVLFDARTPSACGDASSATGPFYCPADEKVYLDLGFFRELQQRFGAKGGDFAEAYVVAHEYGHHVQDLLGTERQMRLAQERSPSHKNELSVRLELQADCYAGVWGHSAYERGKVSSREISDALDAAAAVGDDRIQKMARGRVNPETFTHGSAAQRQQWFERGFETGDPAACDTFRGTP